jgi:hypothetical protein
MKKFLFYFIVGIDALLIVQSCTTIQAQDIPPSVQAQLDSPTATNVFIGTLKDGQTSAVPVTIRQTAPDSIIALNVVFTQPKAGQSFWNWAVVNWIGWITVLLFVAQAVVNLTPTQADNNVFNVLKWIVDSLFKNKKASGGYF